MKIGESFSLISHLINFIIFIYFAITLIKINLLDVTGLSISAFGILVSVIANIISVIENY
jgi:hypothetical protein